MNVGYAVSPDVPVSRNLGAANAPFGGNLPPVPPVSEWADSASWDFDTLALSYDPWIDADLDIIQMSDIPGRLHRRALAASAPRR